MPCGKMMVKVKLNPFHFRARKHSANSKQHCSDQEKVTEVAVINTHTTKKENQMLSEIRITVAYVLGRR